MKPDADSGHVSEIHENMSRIGKVSEMRMPPPTTSSYGANWVGFFLWSATGRPGQFNKHQ